MRLRGSKYALSWYKRTILERPLYGTTTYFTPRRNLRKGTRTTERKFKGQKFLGIDVYEHVPKRKRVGRVTNHEAQSKWRLSMFGSIWQRKTDILWKKRKK